MTFRVDDWVEHPMFGVGQLFELRGDKCMVRFLDHGDKILLTSTPMRRTSSPTTERIKSSRPAKGKRRERAITAAAGNAS
jgi:hypothetical protein